MNRPDDVSENGDITELRGVTVDADPGKHLENEEINKIRKIISEKKFFPII